MGSLVNWYSSGGEVETLVQELALPNDLWVANFNSPRQTVISGTVKGIEIGCGKTLTALHRRIGVSGRALSLEKVDDLKVFEEHFG
jgi:malonyl CoA-acyl carrier protein transacylase